MKFISALFTVALVATASSLSFADAEALWKKNKDAPGFEQYSADFAQYNNHFGLDERDGCYALAEGPVILFLVVTDEAKVATVVADKDNEKAACFIRTYQGLPTKKPPFSPLVLKFQMGG